MLSLLSVTVLVSLLTILSSTPVTPLSVKSNKLLSVFAAVLVQVLLSLPSPCVQYSPIVQVFV